MKPNPRYFRFRFRFRSAEPLHPSTSQLLLKKKKNGVEKVVGLGEKIACRRVLRLSR